MYLLQAFSAITVFFAMLFGIRMIPYGSRYCAEAYVALKRIQEILEYPEYDNQIPVCQDSNFSVQFKNATFCWDNLGMLRFQIHQIPFFLTLF